MRHGAAPTISSCKVHLTVSNLPQSCLTKFHEPLARTPIHKSAVIVSPSRISTRKFYRRVDHKPGQKTDNTNNTNPQISSPCSSCGNATLVQQAPKPQVPKYPGQPSGTGHAACMLMNEGSDLYTKNLCGDFQCLGKSGLLLFSFSALGHFRGLWQLRTDKCTSRTSLTRGQNQANRNATLTSFTLNPNVELRSECP